jgi:hypothetical protein
MGFRLHSYVTGCATGAESDAALAVLRAELPFAPVRRFREPFAGVIAGYDPHELWEAYEADPSRFAFASEEDASGKVFGAEDALPALSRALPGRRIGFIAVDCFGGVCLFEGAAALDGHVFFHTRESTQNGHLEVLQQIGTRHTEWHFEPFTRAFFTRKDDEAPPSGSERRAITGKVLGRVSQFSSGALYVHLTRELVAPWHVRVVGETVLVNHGEDDVLLSLNPSPDGIELGGRCHAPLDEAGRLLGQLVELGLEELGLEYSIELRTFVGELVRAWASKKGP